MPTATIKIFLVHGDPKRLRTAGLSNWPGKGVAGPRSEFDSVLAREESKKSGVYLLTGIDAESGKPALYVGKAKTIRDRIKSHLDKDFWNHAIYFVQDGDSLTEAHTLYLEGRLIEQAHAAGRAEIINEQSSGSNLPESDSADMEIFLEKINQLLPVLGVELLIPGGRSAQGGTEKEVLLCEIKNVRAQGYRMPNGFLVLKGSEAVLQERESAKKWPWTHNLRQKLKDEGALMANTKCLVFERDTEFSSPSAAAAIVHGGHANGLTAWKNSKGKTLKEMEAA